MKTALDPVVVQAQDRLHDFTMYAPAGKLSLDLGATLSNAGSEAHALAAYGVSDAFKLGAGLWAVNPLDGYGTRYGAGIDAVLRF